MSQVTAENPIISVSLNKNNYTTEALKVDTEKYKCIICGHVYDEANEKIKFSDLPDDWKCPICGVGKDKFIKV